MVPKITILLYLFVELFTLNKASLSSNDIETLSNGQYLENFNDQYFRGSVNPQWESEVSEVLQLLGVNGIQDKPADVRKRSNENAAHPQLDVPGHSMNLQIARPKLKWQYTVIATVCSVFAVTGIVVAAACYYKMHKAIKNGTLAGSRSNSSNNGSGIVPLGGSNSGDKKLAQSAQMYHYQHQKQQMIALEKADSNLRNDASDEDSEPDDAVDDFTVYECPGMAMDGELEVKNPLFQADPPSPTGINGDN